MRGRREQIHYVSGQSFRLLRWKNNLREVDSLLPDGNVVRVSGEGQQWHYHVEMELTYFTSGEGIRFIGDHIGPFSAGEVALLGPNVPHHWHVRRASSGLSLQWHFPEGHPFWAFPETFSLAEFLRTADRGISFTGNTALQILQCLQRMTSADALDRLSLMLRLFSVLLNAPEAERAPLAGRAFMLPPAYLHKDAIRDAVRYLIANYREAIRLSDVLRVVRMSKATFARQFRRHAGKTFSDFVTHVRLRSACRELEETDRPIIEVAHASGFSHISFFNRVFRRILKTTPSAYRAHRSTGLPTQGGKPTR